MWPLTGASLTKYTEPSLLEHQKNQGNEASGMLTLGASEIVNEGETLTAILGLYSEVKRPENLG